MSDSHHPASSPLTAGPTPFSRRHFLWQSGGGLGAVALAWMLNRDAARAAGLPAGSIRQPHFAPKAKRVVQIFCAGGVSHLESFDYKPELERLHGQSHEGRGENLGFFGQPGRLMKSVYDFRQHGRSGAWVSSMLHKAWPRKPVPPVTRMRWRGTAVLVAVAAAGAVVSWSRVIR